jgi:hypothetical protein
MFNPETSPQSAFYVPAVEASARTLGVQVAAVPVRATADITPALEGFAHQPNGGLILPTDPLAREVHRRSGDQPSPAADQRE